MKKTKHYFETSGSMNKVLYRAKRKMDGRWVEGFYVKAKWYLTDEDLHVIFPTDLTLYPHSEFSSFEEIIPETLCRLLSHPNYDSDQHHERIWQNDILAVWRYRHADPEKDKPDTIALAVDEHCITEGGLGRRFPQDTTLVRVIGNAYDNPELLTGRDMNHFINGLKEYPGDWHEYIERHRYLSDKYNIHGAQTACYMCNFENDYICHQYNGGCQRIDTCRKIREEEKEV